MSHVENFMNWPDPGTALITGASSGIGAAYARQLAAQGFNLVLVARRRVRLEALASELQEQHGITAEIIIADLSRMEEIQAVAARASEMESLDMLVSDAGFGTIGKFIEVDINRQLDMLNVHNAAAVRLCHAVLRGMVARDRGVIILVSSVMAVSFMPGYTMYSATKAFLRVLAENLALELKGTQIRVQALCPGFTDTEFQRVGDFENWDRSLVPEKVWMSADDVVSSSLANIKEDGDVVYVPGPYNQKLFQRTFGKFVRRRTS